MTDQLVTKPDAGSPIVDGKVASSRMQTFMDDIVLKMNGFLLGVAGVRLQVYAKAALPTPVDTSGRYLIFVTDDVGGSTPAFWDGTNWRRTSDRAVIS